MIAKRPDAGRMLRFGLLVPGFLVIIALLTINIVDRFVLDGWLGLIWIEEVCVILMVWLVFLSAIAIDQDRSHIRVQVITLPPRTAELLEDLAMIAFLGFLVWSTWELLPRVFSKYPATGWSIKVGYYALIVGGALAILSKLLKHIQRTIAR